MQGDCTALLRGVATASIDLVVTDPPYVCRYRDRSGRSVANDHQDDWIAPAFRELYRVLKPDTFCVSFYGWSHVEKFMRAWKEAGFTPVGHIVWPKNYASRRGYTAARHEQAFLLAKGRPPRPLVPFDDVQPWAYTGNMLHPTQKAVGVIRPLIEAFSAPGAVVLDPFLGSGTTGVAAIASGRRFVGMELDPEHFAVAERRITRAAEERKAA
ncbi:MAG: DNA methylase [Rhodospirillales bacterium]|nr:DNA methylase [Rhodospirillales bacterium]